MTTVNVSTTSQLESAISNAVSGEIIMLAPGSYDGVSLNFISGVTNITVQSAVSTNKAILTGLSVNNCANISFNNIEFSTNGAGIGCSDPSGQWPFTVISSQNIKFNQINVYGSPNGTLSNQASGLIIQSSVNCAVTNSTFTYLANGLSICYDNYLNINNNSFSFILDDSIHGGGTSNVVINKNTFTNQFYLPNNTVHPDAIQFWTTNTTQSATNITVTNNTYTRGAGGLVHGVFIKDEVGNLPYQNVTISGNKITGGGWDSIYVLNANNLNVTGNTVKAYSDAISKIWITNATGSVTNNKAANYVYTNDPNLVESGNKILAPVPVPTAATASPTTFAQTMAAMTSGGAVQAGFGAIASGSDAASLAVVR